MKRNPYTNIHPIYGKKLSIVNGLIYSQPYFLKLFAELYTSKRYNFLISLLVKNGTTQIQICLKYQ